MVMGPSAEIEIAASPEIVRSTFLANQRYKEWNHYFEFICTQKPADLQTGDKIKVNIKGSVFGVEIMENSSHCFRWRGGLGALVSGTHSFCFLPSQVSPTGTTLIQKEEFGGLAGALVPVFVSTAQLKTKFETFNEELKAEAEKVAQESA